MILSGVGQLNWRSINTIFGGKISTYILSIICAYTVSLFRIVTEIYLTSRVMIDVMMMMTMMMSCQISMVFL